MWTDFEAEGRHLRKNAKGQKAYAGAAGMVPEAYRRIYCATSQALPFWTAGLLTGDYKCFHGSQPCKNTTILRCAYIASWFDMEMRWGTDELPRDCSKQGC